MRKILLTTDFSDNAWNAIFTALKVFANEKCEFTILHAYEPSMLNLLDSKNQKRLGVIYDSLSQYSQQEMQEVLNYLETNHHNPNHSVNGISKAATLTEAIEEESKEKDMDLLIMGTQGATGAKEVFMGSNTVKAIKTVKNIPILTVPSAYNFQRLKDIIFATDFMQQYEKHGLQPLTDLAKLWDANVKIAHVAVSFVLNDTQKKNKSVLEQRLKGLKYDFVEIPFTTSISNALDTYVDTIDDGFLSIIRHHHTFWQKIIGEPVINKIAFHSNIPVLFLPEHI